MHELFRKEFGNRRSAYPTYFYRFIICIVILGAVNFLFSYKYFSRRLPLPFALSIIWVVGSQVCWLWVSKLPEYHFTRYRFFALTLLILLSSFFLLLYVPVGPLRVDRYLMVHVFWDNFFNGIHPYQPIGGGNVPGPFPVYFLLNLPGYLLGEIGFINLIGLAVYAWLLYRVQDSYRGRILALLQLVILVPFWWEIACRSVLFTNMVFGILTMYWLEFTWVRSRPFFTGALAGLLLSTRSIVIVPLLAYASHLIKRSPGNGFQIFRGGCYALATLAITLLPLYLWHPKDFQEFNPILVQSTLLPMSLGLPILVITAMAATKAKDFYGVLYVSGVLITLSVLASFLLVIHSDGPRAAFWDSKFDISYFLLAIPFLVLSSSLLYPEPHRMPKTEEPLWTS